MFCSILKGIFDNDNVNVIDMGDFLICVVAALVIGLIIALSYMYKTRYTKSFVLTLATLPAIVCVVIMMVNGNIGAGVAVAGAFSLVRFRSVPGTAKEIGMIFLAMGVGLVTGMGYIGYAVIFALIICVVNLAYTFVSSKLSDINNCGKLLKITIPEDLDYTDVFEDLFKEYTKSCELIKVKTTNMGSMFRLTYDVVLKDVKQEKMLIDKIRERNGNLEIIVSKKESSIQEL